MGPEAGPGARTRSRPRLNSKRLAGWWPKKYMLRALNLSASLMSTGHHLPSA